MDRNAATQRELLNAVGRTLDEAGGNEALATAACLSRFHFQRLFRRALGETPGEFRRRLRLERAAHDLQTTRRSVTEIAFEAGYDSLEGFSRAFRQAFSASPVYYRRIPAARWRLPCPNGVHYEPARCGPSACLTGGTPMDLLERLLESDYWLRLRMLDSAARFPDVVLDAPLAYRQNLLPFVEPDRTLRQALDGLADYGAPWMDALEEREASPAPDGSVAGMARRLEISFAEFRAFAYRIRDENRWDECFVDRLCAPPETFSYGGMIAHILTFSTAQRLVVLRILQQMGVEGLGFGDPMEWEMRPESHSRLAQTRAAEQSPDDSLPPLSGAGG